MMTNLKRLVVTMSVLRGMGTVAALTGKTAEARQLVWEDTPLFRKTCFQVTQACFLALLSVVAAHAAPLDLQSVPLYLSAKVAPNVLIDLSVETPMGGAAYNDNTGIPTGCTGRRTFESNPDLGTCYFPTTTYLGYFDPHKCYTYSSSNSRFNPAGATTATHTCSGQWSGNFLNWATMTAIDMFILNMTGGNRTTDTTSLTVVQRARNSGNTSWFPRKVLNSSFNVAPSTVTPYADTTLYIHNTDDTRFQLGTTFASATGNSPSRGPFNVAVKVCDTAVGLESNCVAYGTSPSIYYKPEGLLQKNASSKRFGAISYTLDNAQTRDGGVLRSNMKYVGPTLPDGTTNGAKEYGTDGIFINNPDGATNGLNSGIINYINKFNEPGYKAHDPIGELFYEGLRYFKHLGPTPEYSSGITRSASDAKSGGFWFANSVSDWQDPMQYRCQKNFVIAINDANPWLDKKLPGTFFSSASFVGASGTVNLSAADYGEPSNADPAMNVRTLTNRVGDLEGLNGSTWSSTGTWTSGTVSGTNDSVGGGVGTYDESCTTKTVARLGEVMGTCPFPAKQNSYYIAGLAYYANTTDLRPDFANDRGIQNVQSFFIDTQEYNANPLDGPKNMLWLAGKYGGFVDANGDGIPQTSEWDADGDGVPDNYVLATQPQNLIAGLNKAFAFIDQRTSSASSASVNSGSISSDSRVYQARFNSTNWTGELLSYQVNADGTLTAPDDPGNWEAGKNIPAPGLRQIITTNSDGAAVPFAWSNLDSTRRGQLNANTTVAQEKLNYLRGDASNEVSNPRAFRSRASKLGDIVNSVPVFVGRPLFTYPDTLESQPYSAFRTAQKNRTGVVYVGANDGMLHAFNAADGTELFAYIPGPVFPKLTGAGVASRDLTSPSYTHQFFVDGLPTMGDVFFNNAWHTVLVGGLNQGGQGIYALDITHPASLTESNATSLVLWEFTDTSDADLGYTFTQPSIVRLHNGQWAAIFGNGYNNAQSDGRASTTGYAVLYIVNIQTGSVIGKISTQAGAVSTPNGLATPAVVDLDGDAIADYVFAGDLLGNMWKFDIRDPNPANWQVAYTDGSGKPAPLYVAKDSTTPTPNHQPITDRPEVGRGPGEVGMIVLFGTGKYLEPSDKLRTPERAQSFYGVIDTNTGIASNDIVSGRSALQQQTIDVESTVTVGDKPYNVRVTSKHKGSNMAGWYIDLVSPTQGYQAEKQISRPLLRNGRIIFTTLIPDADPCNFGGTSWLMELDALTGSRLEQSPFDLMPDNQFSTEDMVTFTVDGTPVTVPVSGLQSTVGITPMPGVMVDPGRPVEYKYIPGTSGEIAVIVENPGTDSSGRKAWRQLQ